MPPAYAKRLPALAEVVVRVGLNLQPGQPLLITDPYDLQGIHPEAESLAVVVEIAARTKTTVLRSEPARLRALVEANDLRGYEALVGEHTRQLRLHLAKGGAFLFLTGSEPRLMAGLPADRLAAFDRAKWRQLGPIIQQLIRGATQWTLVPSPSTAWADVANAGMPADERLLDLWFAVFKAMRVEEWVAIFCMVNSPPSSAGPSSITIPANPPTEQWQTHLAALSRRRDELNAARYRRIRYHGAGTDLTLELPASHVWCTAQLATKAGLPFVANLPTEEIFTAPHKNSAHGTVRVARPVVHGGVVIEGIQLEFQRGRVVSATARAGEDALRHLLATDGGACRIGEVALVPQPGFLSRGNRLFHHILLDENAANHIALGEAYRFCSRTWLPLALNSSQVHLDLPLDATAELI